MVIIELSSHSLYIDTLVFLVSSQSGANFVCITLGSLGSSIQSLSGVVYHFPTPAIRDRDPSLKYFSEFSYLKVSILSNLKWLHYLWESKYFDFIASPQ